MNLRDLTRDELLELATLIRSWIARRVDEAASPEAVNAVQQLTHQLQEISEAMDRLAP